jgi:hypothetical protein
MPYEVECQTARGTFRALVVADPLRPQIGELKFIGRVRKIVLMPASGEGAEDISPASVPGLREKYGRTDQEAQKSVEEAFRQWASSQQ